jgi:hypothetical protein
MNLKLSRLITMPLLAAVFMITVSFSIKDSASAKDCSLSVLASPGPGPVHIDVYINGATPGYTVHYTLSYNDGQRVEAYSNVVWDENFHTVIQAPVTTGFVDVTDFYEVP